MMRLDEEEYGSLEPATMVRATDVPFTRKILQIVCAVFFR
jgi:hypothetical protein